MAVKIVKRKDEYLKEIDHCYIIRHEKGFVRLLIVYLTENEAALCFDLGEDNLINLLKLIRINPLKLIDYFQLIIKWWKKLLKYFYILHTKYRILHRDIKPDNIIIKNLTKNDKQQFNNEDDNLDDDFIDLREQQSKKMTIEEFLLSDQNYTNIELLEKNYEILISDLGISKNFNDMFLNHWILTQPNDLNVKDNILNHFFLNNSVLDDNIWYDICSAGYRAPELWSNINDLDDENYKNNDNNKFYNEQSEVWSCGILFFDMIVKGNVRLFRGNSLNEIRYIIKKFIKVNYGKNELPNNFKNYNKRIEKKLKSNSNNGKLGGELRLNYILEYHLYNLYYSNPPDFQIYGNGTSLPKKIRRYFLFFFRTLYQFLHPNPEKRFQLKNLFLFDSSHLITDITISNDEFVYLSFIKYCENNNNNNNENTQLLIKDKKNKYLTLLNIVKNFKTFENTDPVLFFSSFLLMTYVLENNYLYSVYFKNINIWLIFLASLYIIKDYFYGSSGIQLFSIIIKNMFQSDFWNNSEFLSQMVNSDSFNSLKSFKKFLLPYIKEISTKILEYLNCYVSRFSILQFRKFLLAQSEENITFDLCKKNSTSQEINIDEFHQDKLWYGIDFELYLYYQDYYQKKETNILFINPFDFYQNLFLI